MGMDQCSTPNGESRKGNVSAKPALVKWATMASDFFLKDSGLDHRASGQGSIPARSGAYLPLANMLVISTLAPQPYLRGWSGTAPVPLNCLARTFGGYSNDTIV